MEPKRSSHNNLENFDRRFGNPVFKPIALPKRIKWRERYPRAWHYGIVTTALLIFFSKPIYDSCRVLFFPPTEAELERERKRRLLRQLEREKNPDRIDHLLGIANAEKKKDE